MSAQNITDDDRQSIINHCYALLLSDKDTAVMRKARIDAMTTLLFILTGARCEEIRRLQWSDIQLEKCKITIQTAKRGNKRTIDFYPSDTLARAIQSMAWQGLLGSLFSDSQSPGHQKRTMYNRILGLVTAAIGKHDYILHSFRHSWAKRALTCPEARENSLAVLAAQKSLGHKNLNSTMVYVRDIDQEPELKAMAKANKA